MKIKYLFIITALLLLVLTKCAKVSSPTGGPRDSIPPQLISSDPRNYSSNTNEQNIEITFDEFIQLKDVNSTLIISPPLEEKPIVKLKGKTVSIELKNELKDSTTYTLNFGNSIVDNNEGNPNENFEFVFSTGNYVDSFSVTGTLLNSFTLEPSENQVYISLYKNLSDTAPLTQIPFYLGRTDEFGNYSINNISEGKYRLFAIEDANNNLYYDLPNEKIAFFDSVITINQSFFSELDSKPDTMLLDSLSNNTISLEKDTLTNILYKKKYAFHAPLFFFQESFPNQYIQDNERSEKYKMQIFLNEPYRDSILFKIIDPPTENIELTPSFSAKFDTLSFWISDTTIANRDSLKAQFSFYATDSTNNYYWKTDTLDFNYRKPKIVQDRKKRKPEENSKVENQNLKLKTNISQNKVFDLNKNIVVNTIYPIDSIIKDGIVLYSVIDSIKTIEKFDVLRNSLEITKFQLHPEWKPSTTYELLIIPSAVKNIYELDYDSLNLSFKTQEKEYYGSFILNIKNYKNPLIIQLLNEDRSKILDERYCAGDTALKFDYLQPETYQLKMIYDLDSNRQWTTGNYIKNRQPEKIEYYPKPINIRSNWDIEETWDYTSAPKEYKLEPQQDKKDDKKKQPRAR